MRASKFFTVSASILISVVGLQITAQAQSDDARDDFASTYPLVGLHQDVGGKMVILTRPSGRTVVNRYVPFLKSDSVREELELSESQESKVNNLIDTCDSARAEIAFLVGSGTTKKARELIEKKSKNADKMIEDCLLPFQMQRLRQIESRLMFRRVGIEAALGIIEGDLSMANARLTREIKKIQTSWKDEAEKLQEQVIAELLESLNDSEKSVFLDEFGDRLNRLPLDCIVIQLARALALEADKENQSQQPNETQSLASAFRQVGSYTLSADGTWGFENLVSDGSDDSVSLIIALNLDSLKQIDDFVLSEEQSIKVTDLLAQLRGDVDEVRGRRSIRAEDIGDPDVAQDLLVKDLKPLYHRFSLSFLDTLTKSQKNLLRDHYLAKSRLGEGLIVSLVKGSLGEDYQLSDRSRKKLKSECEKQYQSILKVLREKEDEIGDSIGKLLMGDSRIVWDEAFSKPIDYLCPSFSLLLRDSRKVKNHIVK